MCGRYVRKGEPKKVAEFLGVKDGEENWTQSFNVAPSSTIPILTADPRGRNLVPAGWGFTSSGRVPLFNARAETVDSLQSFRDSFRQSRCLVPASGFYEWRPSDRRPFYFERGDGRTLAFAGIWKLVGNHMEAAVITTTPNSDMQGIHHRMPVILEPDAWTDWLGHERLNQEQLQRLLSPSPDNILSRWPVGRGVGSVRNDYPGLIERVEPPATTMELF
jgi:putative SOS response-associated peptidase YedK